VNGSHLRAFFWLRWRLFVNQLRRGGIANVVILSILAALAVLAALGMLIGGFLAGLFLLPTAQPLIHLVVWDVLAVVFLFWWGIGVLTDLQRSEALALDKFLHLPVSLKGAFLINYLSSLFSLSTCIFVPGMAGLTLGLVVGDGAAHVLLLPLVGAFLLMVTALTYQFQGWLASLMANKRRRQTIIVLLTMSMILFCQLPNLINVLRPWEDIRPWDEHAGKAPPTKEEANEKELALERAIYVGNIILPPGWLPLGAMGLVNDNALPALLGTLGMGLIGGASLWRAYRTTVRYYTGQGSSIVRPAPAAPQNLDKTPAYFFEKKLPWVSEPAAAIALASFRSLLRAPEAKMMLLSPILLIIIFGSMFVTRAMDPPEMLRSLIPFGAMAMVLFSMVAMVGNQFGFDRNGFRVYVLCPARRSDILLGKNLAIAPLALGMGGVLALFLAVFYPMGVEYLLAAPAQLLSMFMVFCMMANWLSIISPMAIRPGSLKAAQPKGLAILLSLAFMFLFPAALAPTLLPWAIEVLVQSRGLLTGVPICLVLTLLECAGIGLLYRLVLGWQGDVLQRREQKILDLVTVKSE